MQVPLKIVLRNIASQYKEDIEAEVREWAGKLERFYPGIVSCRVAVEMPHQHHREGNLYKATVTLTVPKKQIVVSREHALHQIHENYRIALREAFEETERQIKEHTFIISKDVKDHTLQPHGVVSKLFPEGYGFIESFGGREVYFHQNSVLDGFEKLKIGTEVRFEEEQGEKGPQASSVKILRKAHAHHRRH
jgi:cold shock CspA family protein/ribosome-associated translation inhibitor RaiA